MILMEYDGPCLVIGEILPARTERRQSLFLGLYADESGDLATWLYVWTGLGGLLSLISDNPMSLRDVIVYEGAALLVEENLRTGETLAGRVVSTREIEDMLPHKLSSLMDGERILLKEFVDRRIAALEAREKGEKTYQ